MLRTNDSKSGTRSYTLGNFRTLLLISHVYKTLCFSFEAFRAVQLIQQIAANLNRSYFKGSTFFDTPYKMHKFCYLSQNLLILIPKWELISTDFQLITNGGNMRFDRQFLSIIRISLYLQILQKWWYLKEKRLVFPGVKELFL